MDRENYIINRNLRRESQIQYSIQINTFALLLKKGSLLMWGLGNRVIQDQITSPNVKE